MDNGALCVVDRLLAVPGRGGIDVVVEKPALLLARQVLGLGQGVTQILEAGHRVLDGHVPREAVGDSATDNPDGHVAQARVQRGLAQGAKLAGVGGLLLEGAGQPVNRASARGGRLQASKLGLDGFLLSGDLSGLGLVGNVQHALAVVVPREVRHGLAGDGGVTQPLKLIGQQACWSFRAWTLWPLPSMAPNTFRWAARLAASSVNSSLIRPNI
jgi:hypothetical protein